MQFNQIKRLFLCALAAGISTNALADNQALETRVKQLEELLKTMQQQRAEQDRQLEILTKELVGIENQMTQKANKAEDERKSKPVVQAENGFAIKSADGQNEIKFSGRVQAEYRTYAKADSQNADTWDLRRAYLTLSGNMYKDYDFKVSGDFAQQNNDIPSTSKTTKTILDEAYFGINWWKEARLRFGQFQMPFGLEASTSDLFNDFTERSMVNALSPFKERGAMVSGNPIDGVYYGLALSTGRGKNASNIDTNYDEPEIIGRATINLAKFLKLNDAVLHFGASFSHAYISNNQTTNSNTLSANTFLVGYGLANPQTEGRGLTFFVPQAITGTSTAGTEIERTRLGAEAAVVYGSLKIQGEYILTNYAGSALINTRIGTTGALSNYDSDIKAWYLSANWLLTGESYTDSYLAENGTWGRIKPKNNVDFANGKFGAVVFGLRYSDYDAGDFDVNTVGGVKNVSGSTSVTTPTGAYAWTAGATWILNPNARLAVNYVDTVFTGGQVAYTDALNNTEYTRGEKAITLRGQYDF